MRRTLWLLDRNADAKAWLALGFTAEQRGSASLDDVKKKFRAMMLSMHPDANRQAAQGSVGGDMQKVVGAKKHLEGRWVHILKERETKATLQKVRLQAPRATHSPAAARRPAASRPTVTAKHFGSGAAPTRKREGNAAGGARSWTPQEPQVRYDPAANPPPPPPGAAPAGKFASSPPPPPPPGGGGGGGGARESSFFSRPPPSSRSDPPQPPGPDRGQAAKAAPPGQPGGAKDDDICPVRVEKLRLKLNTFRERKKNVELGEIFLGLTRHGESLRRS
eukprot:TRINITY_DN1490_c2_g2_i1.p3 TRINITY_DN1490_c2_g2~~TRINITY_DN1490_c2_g2_i1.p3  ORF type:complete len:277 (+),score=83.18 TRINITY_DN1490_c2_g2_i1:80-910(+)